MPLPLNLLILSPLSWSFYPLALHLFCRYSDSLLVCILLFAALCLNSSMTQFCSFGLGFQAEPVFLKQVYEVQYSTPICAVLLSFCQESSNVQWPLALLFWLILLPG